MMPSHLHGQARTELRHRKRLTFQLLAQLLHDLLGVEREVLGSFIALPQFSCILPACQVEVIVCRVFTPLAILR